METSYVGVISRLYGANGRENGSYYNGSLSEDLRIRLRSRFQGVRLRFRDTSFSTGFPNNPLSQMSLPGGIIFADCPGVKMGAPLSADLHFQGSINLGADQNRM